jgi:hypothetical protein
MSNLVRRFLKSKSLEKADRISAYIICSSIGAAGCFGTFHNIASHFPGYEKKYKGWEEKGSIPHNLYLGGASFFLGIYVFYWVWRTNTTYRVSGA